MQFEYQTGVDVDAPVFVISAAAQLAGMHAQTLRSYDRLGLVSPGRTAGGGRRYSVRDIRLLREVQPLSQEDGVNLAGVQRVIELAAEVEPPRPPVAEPPPAGRGAPPGARHAHAGDPDSPTFELPDDIQPAPATNAEAADPEEFRRRVKQAIDDLEALIREHQLAVRFSRTGAFNVATTANSAEAALCSRRV